MTIHTGSTKKTFLSIRNSARIRERMTNKNTNFVVIIEGFVDLEWVLFVGINHVFHLLLSTIFFSAYPCSLKEIRKKKITHYFRKQLKKLHGKPCYSSFVGWPPKNSEKYKMCRNGQRFAIE